MEEEFFMNVDHRTICQSSGARRTLNGGITDLILEIHDRPTANVTINPNQPRRLRFRGDLNDLFNAAHPKGVWFLLSALSAESKKKCFSALSVTRVPPSVGRVVI
jgi:hypothetical protein